MGFRIQVHEVGKPVKYAYDDVESAFASIARGGIDPKLSEDARDAYDFETLDDVVPVARLLLKDLGIPFMPEILLRATADAGAPYSKAHLRVVPTTRISSTQQQYSETQNMVKQQKAVLCIVEAPVTKRVAVLDESKSDYIIKNHPEDVIGFVLLIPENVDALPLEITVAVAPIVDLLDDEATKRKIDDAVARWSHAAVEAVGSGCITQIEGEFWSK